MIEMINNLFKKLVFTKYCDSMLLEYVCEPCEKFDDYYITNGFFLR
jgi:hypothetical protein